MIFFHKELPKNILPCSSNPFQQGLKIFLHFYQPRDPKKLKIPQNARPQKIPQKKLDLGYRVTAL